MAISKVIKNMRVAYPRPEKKNIIVEPEDQSTSCNIR